MPRRIPIHIVLTGPLSKGLSLALLFLVVQTYSLGQSAGDLIGLGEKIPADEYNALVDLYNSITGNEGWSGWLDPEAAFWEGVDIEGVVYSNDNGASDWYVETKGNVDSIWFTYEDLSGSIPDSIDSLTELKYLVLPRLAGLGGIDGGMSGPLPSAIGSLSKLEMLDLTGHNFSGEIPSSFQNITNLTSLKLMNNALTGDIPSWLGDLSELTLLDLSFNKLTGEIPISLGDLQNILLLSLQGNCHSISNKAALESLLPGVTLFLDPGFDCEEQPVLYPDLKPVFIDVIQDQAETLNTIEVEYRIMNDGEGPSGGYTVNFYLSSFANTEVGIYKEELGSVDLPSLAPGETSILRVFKFDVPQYPQNLGTTIAPNQYFVRMEIDPLDMVEETDETNNYIPEQGVGYDILSITGPPIVVLRKYDAHHIGHLGEGFTPGDSMLIKWDLKNIGYGDAEPFFLQHFFDPDTRGSELMIDEFLGKNEIPNGLKSGETKEGDFIAIIPPNGSPSYEPYGNGFYDIVPGLDPSNIEHILFWSELYTNLDEVNRDTIVIYDLCAEISVGEISILDGRLPSERRFDAGDTFQVYTEFRNDSPVLVTDFFDVAVLISYDPVIDPVFDRVIHQSRIEGASRHTIHVDIKSIELPDANDPFWLPGTRTYYIGLVVDLHGELLDCDLDDNITTPPFAKFFEVTVPSTLIGWFYDPVLGWLYGLSSGWFYSETLGYISLVNYPWIYHIDHGFLYFNGPDISLGSWVYFFAEQKWGWIEDSNDGLVIFTDGTTTSLIDPGP